MLFYVLKLLSYSVRAQYYVINNNIFKPRPLQKVHLYDKHRTKRKSTEGGVGTEVLENLRGGGVDCLQKYVCRRRGENENDKMWYIVFFVILCLPPRKLLRAPRRSAPPIEKPRCKRICKSPLMKIK